MDKKKLTVEQRYKMIMLNMMYIIFNLIVTHMYLGELPDDATIEGAKTIKLIKEMQNEVQTIMDKIIGKDKNDAESVES